MEARPVPPTPIPTPPPELAANRQYEILREFGRGGMWIDDCTLSPDGSRYRGRNQDQAPIGGEKVKRPK